MIATLVPRKKTRALMKPRARDAGTDHCQFIDLMLAVRGPQDPHKLFASACHLSSHRRPTTSTALNAPENKLIPTVKDVGAKFVLDKAHNTRNLSPSGTLSVAKRCVPHTKPYSRRSRTHANAATLIPIIRL